MGILKESDKYHISVKIVRYVYIIECRISYDSMIYKSGNKFWSNISFVRSPLVLDLSLYWYFTILWPIVLQNVYFSIDEIAKCFSPYKPISYRIFWLFQTVSNFPRLYSIDFSFFFFLFIWDFYERSEFTYIKYFIFGISLSISLFSNN